MQVVADCCAAYVPGGQTVQVTEAVAPDTVEYVPVGQGMQLTSPPPKLPAVQVVQLVDPCAKGKYK